MVFRRTKRYDVVVGLGPRMWILGPAREALSEMTGPHHFTPIGQPLNPSQPAKEALYDETTNQAAGALTGARGKIRAAPHVKDAS